MTNEQWEEFENLCQAYRHAPLTPQDEVVDRYVELCAFVQKLVDQKV
jgi:hypothetical protein